IKPIRGTKPIFSVRLPIARRDIVPFRDPVKIPLLPVPRGASSLFTWMQIATPGIRSKLLQSYPALGEPIVPSLILEKIMQQTVSEMNLPVTGWDPHAGERKFAKLFNSDEGRKHRLMMLLDLHRHFLPWVTKQGFPKPEDVDNRLAKLAVIHTPPLVNPALPEEQATKPPSTPQETQVAPQFIIPPEEQTTQAPNLSDLQMAQKLVRQSTDAQGKSFPSEVAQQVPESEVLGPALPVPTQPISGLDHETLQALVRHYSNLGDEYANSRNYNRAVQLKEMALRLLEEHLTASADADLFNARRIGVSISLEKMQRNQTQYLRDAIKEYKRKR
ncbi:MAG: hypothetical protein Q8R15_03990, partial [Candidatus Micrarchaeota archaeon]|nr:hypothetical protein [Candidatus Micrarchaeota archaeon]